MTFNPLEYKGNAIFRNQPNHTYFDKSLDDGMDPMFLLLNEIDTYFWQPDQRATNISMASVSVIDPRTQKSITQLEFDHTREEKIRIFQSPKRSILSAKQHKMCVQALNSLQNEETAEEEQLYNWYSTHKARLKEKEDFQKFVAEFCQTSREHMYAPCRKLMDSYQKWYKTRSRKLMKKYSQESYNTHLGLPHVRLCKNALKDMQVQICKPEIIVNLGVQNKWDDNSWQQLRQLKPRLENYMQLYINSEDKQDKLEEELHNLFLKRISKEESNEYPLFYIPLESLLFLLTAGDYIDLPMEVLLNIEDIANEGNENQKIIIMDLPLPSRQAGWHSYQQVVEDAAVAVLSINQVKHKNSLNEEIEKQAVKEVTNIYKVFTLDEYMQNCRASPEQVCQYSKTLIKWQLKPIEEDVHFNIYTSISTTPMKENNPDNLFSLKLEYKPHLGCEIKTKYQLLKEWLHFKLQQNNKITCFRLDINDYKTLLKENLTIQKVEEYLSTFYHINCQQLLANLFEFLKILNDMPCDHYMLRFNPKFKDKLMLCKPSKEITQNTIHLHKLLEIDVSDILFMSQQCFLPIDDNLCSLMHLQHNIIPCAFSPNAIDVKVTHERKSYKHYHEKKLLEKETKRLVKLKKTGSKCKNNYRERERVREQKPKNQETKQIEQEISEEGKMLNSNSF